VNIRALTKLFEVAAERFPDVKYDIKVSLLEIYNVRQHTKINTRHTAATAPVVRARCQWPAHAPF